MSHEIKVNGYKPSKWPSRPEMNVDAHEKPAVQPDWEQNDETAPDYIKNRSHYIHKKLVAEGSVAADDENHILGEGTLASGATYLIEIDGVGAYVAKARVQQTGPRDFSIVMTLDLTEDTLWISVFAGGYQYSDPATGAIKGYFLMGTYVGEVYIRLFAVDELKRLDDAFLPEAVAHKSDIVQSDWKQNNQLDSSFIKNKPEKYSRSTYTRSISSGSNEVWLVGASSGDFSETITLVDDLACESSSGTVLLNVYHNSTARGSVVIGPAKYFSVDGAYTTSLTIKIKRCVNSSVDKDFFAYIEVFLNVVNNSESSGSQCFMSNGIVQYNFNEDAITNEYPSIKLAVAETTFAPGDITISTIVSPI